ncbi:MAG: glycosyl hydrolase [Opitutaceae bacterium]
MCRLLIACSLAFALPLVAADLDWPAITSQTKPWSRWWWLGNIGTKADFTSEMEKYAKAGLGGLEITPIYGVRGQEDRSTQYLSPAWMAQLDHVLDEGQRLGLGIDMSTGTGWPFGGPWVTPETAARHVVTKTFAVKAGERLAEAVTATDLPVVRVAGPRQVKIEELKDPAAANPNQQDLSLDQVRFPRRTQLQALVAHSDTGQKVVLTDKVDVTGKLDWIAPAGNWTLYAVFMGWHGKQVERAGPGGEGDAIDHFSADALGKYLKKFDDAYVGHRANRLRGYFNDSYEVDDASGESNWTPRFFEEFRRRRGYDLRDELPAFFGKDTEDKNSRAMADHRETISDLLLEQFTVPWAKWAKTHGGIVRNQAHGSPANIVDLYAASDIPETEGTNIVGMKLASSAAHVTGKQLTSAETATWLDEHWVSTLGDIKRRVDQMFLGGVNHNCYHGTVFSPPGEPWPGHHFYAAVELDPSNSIWSDFDALNGYVARVQSFLQAGKPANDILLYYPIHDVWAQRGNGAMPHFGSGGGGAARGGAQVSTPQELLNRGFTFDFVTDRLIANVQFRDGAIETGGARYRVVVVPETKFMPLDTFYHLYRLAEAGATIVFHRKVPGDVPGLGKLLARRSEFQVHTETLRRGVTGADGITTLTWNRGRLLVGENLDQLLERAAVRREALVDKGLQFERRTHDKGHTYFLLNRTNAPVEGWVPLATAAAQGAMFDPMTGRRGVVATRKGAGGADEVFVQLAPTETCILKTFATEKPAGPAFAFRGGSGAASQTLGGPWTVRFVSGGPTLPDATQVTGLRSWTEWGPETLKAFAGTALYTAKLPPGRVAGDVLLDLGRVADSARVKVNGKEIGTLIDAPWQLVVPRDALSDGENTLEIAVTNLAANRIADLDRRDPSWKKFYNTNMPARIAANRGADGNFSAAKWTPRVSGLIGPVTLTPVVWQIPQ